uniref:Ketoreductase domain-containing protein n=1 Tax=Chromera velia CCMP2878 TaxID=1169474 RepID=A0A0G4H9Z3_9ALVE|mmetsp:Transcript_8453/g.16440  ORF Transcript_8453/g.16440 Transcript_8453/m.16440 type:complete len:271 (-) Transcript_8453:375-1187(-)|eukprot:Cvel_25571.t1-p1 / transcript=Cvel_25571.t1 / gene=Cvel_25571 / organism=Chromera_velia_CCMP2878 / gene_product=Uncharacterized oxidoreductase C521.03, putative / transcript_product=Uncharacterized oxidoreductase C521.03, putative / location=Cvel_scaffold2916:17993-18802(-) / protein_length=270 / sequence_SO=supercontig / SO=protein_coding / is_pseudo=false
MASALYPSQSLAGDTVLVTGATAGIGEACAWRFAEAGCKLVLTGRRTDRLQALEKELKAAYPGLEVRCISFDVSDTARAAALPAELLPWTVDILVNNAGLALGVSSVVDNDITDMQTMLNTNVLGLMAMTTAFVSGMRSRGKGHVINIGSVAGKFAYVGGSGYCASKFAVDAFTTAARHDLVGTPIRVTSICPGLVNTEFSTVRLGSKDKADKVYEGVTPLVAKDIADNVLYAVTRPPHVQIADMLVYATNQSGPKNVARVGPSLGAPAN